MKYKRIYLFLYLAFVLFPIWLINNLSYIKGVWGIDKISTIVDMNSGYYGFNSVLLHGSAYILLFALIFSKIVKENDEIVLIRFGTRKRYVILLEEQLIGCSIKYVISLYLVNLLCCGLFIQWQQLLNSGIIFKMALFSIFIMLYYFFLGNLFLLLSYLANSLVKGIFFAFLFGVALLWDGKAGHILKWNPLDGVIVLDDIMQGNTYKIQLLWSCIRISIMALCIAIVFLEVFIKKDVMKAVE